MTDCALTRTAAGGFALSLSGGDLKADESLRPAVYVSLLTDREAPDERADRRGWWGDVLLSAADDRIGSLLWLLVPGLRSTQALADAQAYIEQALQHLIDGGYCSSITVQTWYSDAGELDGLVQLQRPSGINQYRLAALWRASLSGETDGD